MLTLIFSHEFILVCLVVYLLGVMVDNRIERCFDLLLQVSDYVTCLVYVVPIDRAGYRHWYRYL